MLDSLWHLIKVEQCLPHLKGAQVHFVVHVNDDDCSAPSVTPTLVTSAKATDRQTDKEVTGAQPTLLEIYKMSLDEQDTTVIQ